MLKKRVKILNYLLPAGTSILLVTPILVLTLLVTPLAAIILPVAAMGILYFLIQTVRGKTPFPWSALDKLGKQINTLTTTREKALEQREAIISLMKFSEKTTEKTKEKIAAQLKDLDNLKKEAISIQIEIAAESKDLDNLKKEPVSIQGELSNKKQNLSLMSENRFSSDLLLVSQGHTTTPLGSTNNSLFARGNKNNVAGATATSPSLPPKYR